MVQWIGEKVHLNTNSKRNGCFHKTYWITISLVKNHIIEILWFESINCGSVKTSVNYGQWSAVKTICHSNGRPIKKRMAHKNKKHLNLLKVFWCMSSLMRVIRSLNSFGPIFTIHLIGIDRSSLEYRQEMTSDRIISFGNQSFDLFVCNWQTQTNIGKRSFGVQSKRT